MSSQSSFSIPRLFLVSALMAGVLAACGAPAAPAAQASAGEPPAAQAAQPAATEAPALLQPGEPGAPTRTIQDTESSLKAAEKRAVTGDKFLDNLYERPFDARDMAYLPDVDITFASIASDEQFHYFSILLQTVEGAAAAAGGAYGIEFDRSLSGRGDLLVLAEQLSAEWSTAGVKAYEDKNQDVGGLKPMAAESDFKGDGYESELAFAGDKVAYARVLMAEKPVVQIAVSRALLGNPERFLWGAWADRTLKAPHLMDYNDVYTRRQAGSPIRGDENYPLKDVHSIDNTCRLPMATDLHHRRSVSVVLLHRSI